MELYQLPITFRRPLKKPRSIPTLVWRVVSQPSAASVKEPS